MAILYRHIRLDKNEVFYIGIGKDEKRAYQKNSRNKYWRHITNKTEYEVEIIFDDLSWEQACEKEIEFIALYGRNDLNKGTLVNRTDGGEGRLNSSITFSKEHKLKLSKSNIISGKKRGKKIIYNGIEYDSIREASRLTNIPRTTLKRKINNGE